MNSTRVSLNSARDPLNYARFSLHSVRISLDYVRISLNYVRVPCDSLEGGCCFYPGQGRFDVCACMCEACARVCAEGGQGVRGAGVQIGFPSMVRDFLSKGFPAIVRDFLL